jgi:hypothetical protein
MHNNTRNSAYTTKTSFCLGVAFLVSIMLILSTATRANETQQITTGNSTLVFTVSDSNEVVITQGKITASEGQSIRLLPGTSIKGTDKVAINIADKTCQETVAEELTREKEGKMVAKAAERRKEVIATPARIEEETAPLVCFSTYPGGNSSIAQQRPVAWAAPVAPTASMAAPVCTIVKKQSIPYTTNVKVLDYGHTPTRSWGDATETIKVLRC